MTVLLQRNSLFNTEQSNTMFMVCYISNGEIKEGDRK